MTSQLILKLKGLKVITLTTYNSTIGMQNPKEEHSVVSEDFRPDDVAESLVRIANRLSGQSVRLKCETL